MDSETLKILGAIGHVIEKIDKVGFNKYNPGSGIMKCPICKGDLFFSVSGVNGHRLGRCRTYGCLNWIE